MKKIRKVVKAVTDKEVFEYGENVKKLFKLVRQLERVAKKFL